MPATRSAIEYAMYPPPIGRHLSEEQARELDDTFLASDPFSYFQSRIASLMSWDESVPDENQPLPDPEPGSIRARFNAYLQRPAAAGPFDKLDVHAQVAADALSVRHHAAEALVRLACARLAPQPLGGARCLWAEMAASPRQLPDVVDRLNKSGEDAEPPEKMFRAVVPPDERATRRSHEGTVDAVNTYVDWLWYASTILEPGEINLHAAHNKVKHGLAVRTRSDLRMTFTTTRPNVDGSMSANMLNDGVDLFHHPVLELLADAPNVDGHRQGMEVTQLHLNTAAILAEAFMMAMAHGALFHVAAVEHFSGRDDLRERIPVHPGYPVGGPRPEHINAKGVMGMRFPITNPPGGGAPRRESGVGFRDRFQPMRWNWDERIRGRVVDG